MLFNLRSIVQQYVRAGMQRDSLRRQLNREGIKTRGLELGRLWSESVQELFNQRQLVGRASTLRPRPGRDMLARPFKDPYNFRYVVQLEYLDPETGEPEVTALSVLSNDELTKGEAQRRALSWAEATAGPEGRYGVTESWQLLSTELINAYYNEGI